MIWTLAFLAILIFNVVTDQVQAEWPHLVFRAAACLLCAVYLVSQVLRKYSLRFVWSLVPISLVVIWGLVQLGLNLTVWRYATWNSTLQWIAYLALFLAASQCGALRSNLRLFAWFGGACSLYALIQYAYSSGPGERMAATFLNHNHYAALIELLFPIALWRLFRDAGKATFFASALLMIGSVAAVGSRAGMILLLLELLYLGLRTSRRPVLVFLGAIVISTLAAGAMWSRFEALSTREPYDSRSATARASLRMIRDRPITGFGLGTWANVYPAYADQDTGFRLIHADDDWLEWTAEGGVPFAFFMLALAAFAIRSAWKEPWCAGCVAVMLHSLVEFPLQKQAIWAGFLILLATAQPFVSSRKQSALR